MPQVHATALYLYRGHICWPHTRDCFSCSHFQAADELQLLLSTRKLESPGHHPGNQQRVRHKAQHRLDEGQSHEASGQAKTMLERKLPTFSQKYPGTRVSVLGLRTKQTTTQKKNPSSRAWHNERALVSHAHHPLIRIHQSSCSNTLSLPLQSSLSGCHLFAHSNCSPQSSSSR